MDINDSNNKSQTGGLKLMTVFIAVLALHVVVIGGFTVYHLMSGGSSDTDMTTSDKTHKGLNGAAMTESTLPDVTQSDKTTITPPTEVATIPSTTVTPEPTTTTPDASAPATTPDASAVTTTSTPAPASITTPAPTVTPEPTSATTTASTTPASSLAPPPEPTASTVTPAPDAALTSPTSTSTEAASPTPVTEVATPAPQAQAPTGPISAQQAPPPEAAPASAPAPAPAPAFAPQPAPASSFASGPVHMPPANLSAQAPRPEHEHMKIYIVKITDSYKKIAHRHHITVAQLKEANHITNNVLHTGQKLYVPSEKTEVAEKAPTSTLDAAPIVNESTAPITTGLTSTSTTYAATGLHHHLYTVVKGDTLTKIAHRYKTTASAIMAENGITHPTKLTIGKKLRIPSSEETRSARAVPVTPQPSQVQAKTGASTAQLANYAN
jgi:LysM repeat protein